MKYYFQLYIEFELFFPIILLSSSPDMSVDRRIVIATHRLRICQTLRFELLLVLLVDVLSTC
jgi:hypothetical protein